jgi:hypothetical protein
MHTKLLIALKSKSRPDSLLRKVLRIKSDKKTPLKHSKKRSICEYVKKVLKKKSIEDELTGEYWKILWYQRELY